MNTLLYRGIFQLNSMRWFSHRCRSAPADSFRKNYTARGLCRRGWLPNKMPHFFVFVPVTLTLKLRWDYCTMHLTAKFHRPTFNRSEVIMLTNWQTNRCRWKHPSRSAMLCRWVITKHLCIFWLNGNIEISLLYILYYDTTLAATLQQYHWLTL